MEKTNNKKDFIKFQKPVKKRPPSKVLGAIDIETVRVEGQVEKTSALGGECAILTYAYEQVIKVKRKHANDARTKREIKQGYVKDWRAFFELLQELPELQKVDWFIHNLEFDFARAHGEVIKFLDDGYTMEPIINGLGKYIAIKIKYSDKRIFFKCRDSAAVISGTLADISKNLAPDNAKMSGAIDFDGGEQFDINNPVHVAYAMQDTLSLLHSMINLENLLIEHYQVPLRLTAASISMLAFRKTLYDAMKAGNAAFYKRSDKSVRTWQRQAYYGGFVYCGEKTGQVINEDLYHYDFSSCYPYVMRKFGVPVGAPVEVYSYKPGDIGIYRVKVTVSDDHIPIVPLRTKTGIVWPRGVFETTITSVDLESCAVHKIPFEVIEGLRFREYAYPFEAIVNTCEGLRKQYKGTAVEMMAKLIQNSLYGKFASKEELTETIFKKELDDEYDGVITGDYSDFVTLDSYRQTKNRELDEDYLIVSWAAFITAQARKHLHNCMLIAGKENIHYTDTDSLVMTLEAKEKLTAAGKIANDNQTAQYGDLVHENTYKRFLAIAPKVYASLNVKGEFKGKIKGVPKKLRNGELFERILNGDEISAFEFESVCGLNAVFKNGDFSTIRTRKMTDFDNCVGWVNNGGKVLSIHVDDVKNINDYLTL